MESRIDIIAGTSSGWAKARQTMIDKHFNGSEEKFHEWQQYIGSLGGSQSNEGGFASKKIGKDGLTGRERASKYGAMGGRISRKAQAVTTKTTKRNTHG